MHTLKRVDLGSSFRIGSIVGAILFAVFGAVIIVLPTVLGAGLFDFLLTEEGGRSFATTLGVSVVAYLVGIVLYGLVGGLLGAIAAWAFNVAAARFGGLRIDLE